MADLETRVEKLDDRVTSLEIQFSALMTKVDTTINELHDMRKEMRDRDNQRAEDIRELRQKQEADMKEIRQKQEEDIREIRTSIDGMGKHVRNLAITSMAAIGAMVVTVIISFLKN